MHLDNAEIAPVDEGDIFTLDEALGVVGLHKNNRSHNDGLLTDGGVFGVQRSLEERRAHT